MIKILFVCHGNICRSTMCEFVFKELVRRRGLSDLYEINSAATSREEIGDPIHPGTRRKLTQMGIPFTEHYAVQITHSDWKYYDYILCMDQRNLSSLKYLFSGKASGTVCRLLDFSDRPRDIADPWYTGNFDDTYNDVLEGCTALLRHLSVE